MRASYTDFHERQRLMKRDNRICECGHKFLYHDVDEWGKTECFDTSVCPCVEFKEEKSKREKEIMKIIYRGVTRTY